MANAAEMLGSGPATPHNTALRIIGVMWRTT